MLGHGPTVLADDDAVGVGVHLHRTADGVGGHRVLVIVEAYQARLRYCSGHRVEAVEPSGIRDQLRAFRLEHVPDRLVAALRMAMGLGVGNAVVEQPGVELLVALAPQPGREEALAHKPDLVLDLSLLPARGRRAGHRVDEVVAAHLHEPAIVDALLADEDGLDRRLHVVVDPAPTGALEEGEGPVVGVEHHLLRLARIDTHERQAAVTEPHVRGLHDHRRAIEHDHLVAPVELVGFPRCEAQRDIRGGRRLPVGLAPPSGVPPHGIVAARVATPAQFLKDPDQRQLLARCLGHVTGQQRVEIRRPPAQLRSRLDVAIVLERGLARAQHLTHRIPRHPEVSGDLLDRLALNKNLAPYPTNRLHRQHPRLPSFRKAGSASRSPGRGQFWTPIPPVWGSTLHAETQVAQWCEQTRHWSLVEQHQGLSRKLRGHFAYYGITGNGRALSRFRTQVVATWFKWLNRRGGQRRWTWERYARALRVLPLPDAIVVHSVLRHAAR